MKTILAYTSAVLAGAVLLGCVAPAPQPRPSKTLSCNLPVITTLPQTTNLQERGGIQISVIPTTYQVARGYTTNVVRVRPTPGEIILQRHDSRTGQPYPWVEERVEPFLNVNPAKLTFQVTINNKLERV